MGGAFGDAFSAGAFPGFKSWLGEPVLYRLLGESVVEVTGVVNREMVREEVGERELLVTRGAVVRIAVADLDGTPGEGDEFEVDGVVLGVEGVTGPAGGRWVVSGRVLELDRMGSRIR